MSQTTTKPPLTDTRLRTPPPPESQDGHPREMQVKEDDQENMEDNIIDTVKEVKESGSLQPPRMVKRKKNNITPPPPPPRRHGCPLMDGGDVPERAGGAPSMYTGVGMACNSQSRAAGMTGVKDSDEFRSTIPFDVKIKKTADTITVNGVNLMTLQKMKNNSIKKTTPKIRKITRKKSQKTETTTPSDNKIVKYLVKKKTEDMDSPRALKTTQKEDNKENTAGSSDNTPVVSSEALLRNSSIELEETYRRKTTFMKKHTMNTAKQTIKMFQELERGEECLLGSGRCSTHNVKLARKVSRKRVSTVADDGSVKWTIGEGVVLACPYKQGFRVEPGSEPAPLETEGTNGNKRICLDRQMNQPQTETQIDFGREDLLLDGMKTDCWPPDR